MATSLGEYLRKVVLLPDGGGMSDCQLLECYVSRQDEAAFTALVKRHGPMVLSVCRRVLRNTDDAEDAFQATFLVLVRKARSVLPREMVGNWLYGVAYRTALKARSASAKRREKERTPRDMSRHGSISDGLWQDLEPLLDRELEGLPDKYRVPIVLCDLEGKSRSQVAKQLGWPEGTVAARLTRARKLLAKRLARHGLSLSAAGLAVALSQRAAAAVVRPSLVVSTTKAAILFAGGTAATTAVISAKVAGLAQGVLKAMLISKLKIATVFFTVLSIGGTAGVITLSAFSRQSADAAAAKAEKPKVAETDKEKLQGTWTLVSAEVAGVSILKAEIENKRIEYVFKDNKITVNDRATQTTSHEFTFKLDPSKEPKEIDFAILENGKTVTSKGIYALDGDTFKTCIGGQKRPTDFKAEEGDVSGAVLKVFKRDSPAKPVAEKEPQTLKRSLAMEGHQRAVTFLAFSRDGKMLASASQDGTVMLWEVATGKPRLTLKDSNPNGLLSFSADGKTLAIASGKEVGLWDVASGKLRKTLSGDSQAWCAVFSPDGQTLAIGRGVGPPQEPKFADEEKSKLPESGLVELRDIRRDNVRVTLEGHKSAVMCVAFSHDGKTLVSGSSDKSVRLWDTKTGQLQRTLKGHTDIVWSVAFSPDGKTVASGCRDNMVKTWNAKTGALKRTIDGLYNGVWSVAFSPDGKSLAIAGLDRSSNAFGLWDVEAGKLRVKLEASESPVWSCLAFSPDGKTLAAGGVKFTGDSTNKVYLWQLDR